MLPVISPSRRRLIGKAPAADTEALGQAARKTKTMSASAAAPAAVKKSTKLAKTAMAGGVKKKSGEAEKTIKTKTGVAEKTIKTGVAEQTKKTKTSVAGKTIKSGQTKTSKKTKTGVAKKTIKSGVAEKTKTTETSSVHAAALKTANGKGMTTPSLSSNQPMKKAKSSKAIKAMKNYIKKPATPDSPIPRFGCASCRFAAKGCQTCLGLYSRKELGSKVKFPKMSPVVLPDMSTMCHPLSFSSFLDAIITLSFLHAVSFRPSDVKASAPASRQGGHARAQSRRTAQGKRADVNGRLCERAV